MSDIDTVWLTGAGNGIGRALALKLLDEGKRVAGSGRTAETLESIADELGPADRERFMSLPCDVTSDESMRSAYSALVGKWGVPDMVIANAGTYFAGDGGKETIDSVSKTLAVNLEGGIRTLLIPLPDFLSRRKGILVGVSSPAGYRGLPQSGAYGASKAGLTHYLESLRFDIEQEGVAVVIVSPGFVKTRLTDKNDFPMPLLLTVEQSANHIWKGLCSKRLEIHYPRPFTLFLKFLRILPYPLYAWIVRRISKKRS